MWERKKKKIRVYHIQLHSLLYINDLFKINPKGTYLNTIETS
jgi:hypothetical protein